MTNEEMIVLAKGGNTEIYERFFQQNQRLAYYIARQFESTRIDVEELASLAKIGMIKAYNSFDTTKAIKFATFATRCMQNEILMFIRKQKKHVGITSLHEAMFKDDHGGDITLEDMLEDTRLPEMDAGLMRESLAEMTRGFLATLTERDRDIFISTVLSDDTQRDIAERLNVSQSWISRVEKSLIKKYRKYAKKAGFTDVETPIEQERKSIVKRTPKKEVAETNHNPYEQYASLNSEIITYQLKEEPIMQAAVTKEKIEIIERTKENYLKLRKKGLTNKEIAVKYFGMKGDSSLYYFLDRWGLKEKTLKNNEFEQLRAELEKVQAEKEWLETQLTERKELNTIEEELTPMEMVKRILNNQQVRIPSAIDLEIVKSALDILGAEYNMQSMSVAVSLRNVG